MADSPPIRAAVTRQTLASADPAAYAYLLGLYLGDGCLGPRGYQLTVALDAQYPGIVKGAEEAIAATVPNITTRRYRPKDNVIRVIASSSTWRDAFPQHGRGRKHLRSIELVPWQRETTQRFPRELLRGLIHSDGCRTTNRFKTQLPSGRIAAYEHPRYFFPTSQKTYVASSATTASCSAFVGPSQTLATSRSRIAKASR